MGIGSIFGNTPCPGRKDQASGKLQQFAAGGRNRRTEAMVGIIRIATSGRKGHLPRFPGRRFGHHRAAQVIRENCATGDRKSVVSGKSVSVRVELGGRRIIKKKNTVIMRIKDTELIEKKK